MLTGKHVRVRFGRDRITPQYLDVDDPYHQEIAARLLDVFRSKSGCSRGEIEEEIKDVLGADATQLVAQGLAKLLEDRGDYEVVSGKPPEEVREALFSAACKHRQTASVHDPFPRDRLVSEVAARFEVSSEQVERELFADLKSEQRLLGFKDITPNKLLERYNVALAQAMVLRAVRVEVEIRNELPQRFRQLFRRIKFHRLICEASVPSKNALRLILDGPLSLFLATQKYGLQLALFLPALLLCRNFVLSSNLLWGAQRKPKVFGLSSKDGLVSHESDVGMYVPPEIVEFAGLFRKKIADWDLRDETEVYPLGDSFWVPDYRLVEKATGRTVLLEIAGFWRRQSVQQHYDRLARHAGQPFVLAVSNQLQVDDVEDVPGEILRFRAIPLPEDVVVRAQVALSRVV